jgi:hypothetical protein
MIASSSKIFRELFQGGRQHMMDLAAKEQTQQQYRLLHDACVTMNDKRSRASDCAPNVFSVEFGSKMTGI